MNLFFIVFFSLTTGVVAGFFAASLFAVARMQELHEHYQRREIEQKKAHIAEVAFLKSGDHR